jgi:putative proteasome-type protease
MTYCVAISLGSGICFISDSRTNAGVDNVSTYSKMNSFGIDGERQIVLLSAGNLATTQGVVTQLKKDIKKGAEINLHNLHHMEDVADYVGAVSIAQQERNTGGGSTYEARFIVGGQIAGFKPKAYLIYPQGNISPRLMTRLTYRLAKVNMVNPSSIELSTRNRRWKRLLFVG